MADNFDLVADVLNAAVRWQEARVGVLLSIATDGKGVGFDYLAEAEMKLSDAVKAYQAAGNARV
jgi:hypothetical protein